ncbi:unnamed protein product [Prunus armeniaca]|uniref:Uncharacterized protein n=1 Tax=Prunus armeniaca TaxID=36596 RepID=A0A6J5WGN5_PRUAR|nr:unnamed protein product [Prunus armeniaca]CAB4298792.1 unnamed protein product [Prunus armeniaca]
MKPVFRVADGAPFQGSVMRLHISGHHEWCLFFQCLITSPTVQRGVKVIFKLPITEVSNGGDDGLKKFQGSREARVWMWMGQADS